MQEGPPEQGGPEIGAGRAMVAKRARPKLKWVRTVFIEGRVVDIGPLTYEEEKKCRRRGQIKFRQNRGSQGSPDTWSCPVSSAPQSDMAAYSDNKSDKKSARAKVLDLSSCRRDACFARPDGHAACIKARRNS